MRGFESAALLFFVLASAAVADDFDMPIRAFPDRMTQTFRSIKDRTKITEVSCLDGNPTSRTVCTYRLDRYMEAIAAGEPGASTLSDLTLICTPHADIDSTKCLIAYGAAFGTLVPDMSVDDRGRIISFLLKGLPIGDAAQLTKDGHRYILQHVGGALWFNYEANEE